MHDTRHPREAELACAKRSAPGRRADQTHLLWCRSCRGAAADYVWLRSELMTVMGDVAEIITVPAPAWGVVRSGTLSHRRRQLARLWLAATSGVALAVCLAFVTPRLGNGTAVASATASGGPFVLREIPTAPAVVAASAKAATWQVVTPTPSAIAALASGLREPLAPMPVPTAPGATSG